MSLAVDRQAPRARASAARVPGALLAFLALLAAPCAGGPRPQTPTPAQTPAQTPTAPIRPPRGVDAPAEVVWTGTVSVLKAGGLSGVLRSVAGASSGGEELRLRRPISVALGKGAVWAVDTAQGLATRFSPSGGRTRVLSLPGGFTPVAVATERSTGRGFVVDGTTGKIACFSESGQFERVVSPSWDVRRAGGLAVLPDGKFLLTDVDLGAVLLLAPDGKAVKRVGRRGTGTGELNYPTALATAPDGTYWVLDSLNFRVHRLNEKLEVLATWGELGDGTGHFALPKGLAVDDDGHVWVSDAGSDRIQVFDPSGRLLLVVGSRGDGPGELWNPAGLAIGPEGAVAVADSGNGRIQLLRYQKRKAP